MKYFKIISIWLVCFAFSLFFLVQTRPDHRVTVGTAIASFMFAPLMAPIGGLIYIFESDLLTKCVLGC